MSNIPGLSLGLLFPAVAGHVFAGGELGGLAFVAAGCHPGLKSLVKVFLDVGEVGGFGQVLEFERIFDDVVEFEFGAVLVALGFGEGVLVTGRGEFEPASELWGGGAGVFKFHFRGEVPDEFVFPGPDGADAVVRGAIVDALGGHDSVDVGFVILFSRENGEEAFSAEGFGSGASGGFDEGWKDVEVLDHGGIGGAGFDLSGPAGDESGLEAVVVAGPFGEGEGAALFGGDDEEGVVGESIFFDEVHRLADLGIKVGDFGEIAAHPVACFRGVDEVGWKLHFVGRIAGGIALVPRGVGFIGAEEEAEWFLFGGLFFDEGADLIEFGILAAGDLLPIEDLSGRDVGFSALGDSVAEAGEVLDDAFCFGSDEGVVWVGAAQDGREAGVDVVPGGGTHRGGLETAGEAHPLGGEFVDVGGVGLSTIATEVAESAVVCDDEDDVGFGGSRQREE